MKKIFLFVALLMAAMFALCCTTNEIGGDLELLTDDGHHYAEIIACLDDDSKTVMHADANGYNFEWSGGDRLYLTEYRNEAFLNGYYGYINIFESESLKSGGSTATFTIDYGKTEELENPVEEEYCRYIAAYPMAAADAYPVDEYGSLDFKGEPHHLVFKVNVPNVQFPTADMFDPEADVMVSQIIQARNRPNSFNFRFARVGAVLKLRLTGLPVDAQVTYGEINTDAQGGEEWGPAYYEVYDPYRQRTSQPDKPTQLEFHPSDVYVDEYGIATIWLRVKGGVLREQELTVDVYAQQGKDKAKHYGYSIDMRGSGKKVTFMDGGMTILTLGVDRIHDVATMAYSAETVSSTGATVPVHFDLDEIPYETVVYGVCYNESAISDVPTIEFDNCKVAESVDPEGYAEICIDNLKSNTEYSYRSYVIVDGEVTYSSREYFTTEVSYEAPVPVDLGLPSGVKWSPFNLGATSPEDGGYFYRWGEVDAYRFYSNAWYNYRYSNGNYYSFNKYVSNIVVGSPVDHKRVLEAADDAATYNFGEGWRTACKADFEELISNCDLSLEDVNGVECFKFTSRINSNCIYFPKNGRMYKGDLGGNGVFGKCRCADMAEPIEKDMSDAVNCIYFNVDNDSNPYWGFETDSKAEYADGVRPVYGGSGVARQVAWTYEPSAVGSTSVSVNVKFDLTVIPGYVPNVNDDFYVVYCKSSKRISYLSGGDRRPAPTLYDDNVKINEVSEGLINVQIYDLEPSTEYVFRAYARLGNPVKHYYGETYSFTTHAAE